MLLLRLFSGSIELQSLWVAYVVKLLDHLQGNFRSLCLLYTLKERQKVSIKFCFIVILAPCIVHQNFIYQSLVIKYLYGSKATHIFTTVYIEEYLQTTIRQFKSPIMYASYSVKQLYFENCLLRQQIKISDSNSKFC